MTEADHADLSRRLALADFARFDALFCYDKETGILKRKQTQQIVGSLNDRGYLTVNLNKRNYRVHRVAWLLVTGSWPSGDIDHINGNRSDNRWSNIRDVSTSVNLQNQRQATRVNKVGLLGVSKDKKRWRAQIQINGKNMRIGSFDTPLQAHQAYLSAKRRLHEGCAI